MNLNEAKATKYWDSVLFVECALRSAIWKNKASTMLYQSPPLYQVLLPIHHHTHWVLHIDSEIENLYSEPRIMYGFICN